MTGSVLCQSIQDKSGPPTGVLRCGRFSILLAALVGISAVQAQQLLTSSFNEPEIIETRELRYPLSGRIDQGEEGWVVMEYCVEADGSIDRIKVADSVGGEVFERQALRTLQQFRFKPATRNDAPIRYCQNYLRFIFDLPEAADISEEFIGEYEKVNEAIVAQQLGKAEAGIESIASRTGLNLYEHSWIQVAKAQLAIAKGNDKEALKFSQRARFNDGSYLEPQAYAMLQAQEFVIDLKLHRYGEALVLYETMKAMATKPENFSMIERVAEELKARFGSSDTFNVPVELDEEGKESYTLFRNKVSIQVPDGESPPEQVALSCTELAETDVSLQEKPVRFYEEYGYIAEQLWYADLGKYDCSLIISGRPGQRFALIQHPE